MSTGRSEAGEGRVTYSSPSRCIKTLDKILDILMFRESPSSVLGRSLPVWIRDTLLLTFQVSTPGHNSSLEDL